jgi:hypothetical protein
MLPSAAALLYTAVIVTGLATSAAPDGMLIGFIVRIYDAF